MCPDAFALTAVQPAQRGLLAVAAHERGDDRLEVGLLRGQRQLALELRVGEVLDVGGQLGGLDQLRVVDDHADPGRHPGPVALRRAVLSGRQPERGGLDRGQQALVLEQFERRGVLGEEQVRGGARALGGDLVGQRVLVVAAHVDGDTGLVLERLHQRLGGLRVLPAVQRQGRARAGSARGTAAAGGEHTAGRDRAECGGRGRKPGKPPVPATGRRAEHRYCLLARVILPGKGRFRPAAPDKTGPARK